MNARFQSLAWWYWAVTAPVLGAGLAGWDTGFALAIGLAAAQVVHFGLRNRRPLAFQVQVRVAYLAILLLAWWEPLRWVYWLPFLGTSAMVLFDICPLARALSLLPWNRGEPLTLELVLRTLLSPPSRFGVVEGHVAPLPPPWSQG